MDDLTCVICQRGFEDPRMLRCGHTFCRDCVLDSILGTEVACPMCRIITHIDSFDGVASLPVNTLAKKLLKQIRAVNQTCEECGVELASLCCHKCDTVLCAPCCELVHSPHRALSKHVAVPWSRDISTPRGPICPVHEEKVKYFCKTDDTLLCGDCVAVGPHRDHAYFPVSDCAKERCKVLTERVRKGREVAARVATGAKYVEKELDKTQVNVVAVKAEISRRFEELRMVLSRREKALIAQADTFGAAKKETLSTQHGELKNYVSCVATNIELADKVLDLGDDFDIIDMERILHPRLTVDPKDVALLPLDYGVLAFDVHPDVDSQTAKLGRVHQESNYHIEGDSFVYTIRGLSKIGDQRLVSAPFMIHGSSWVLVVYPKGTGDGKDNSMSAFLAVHDMASLGTEWQKNVDFSLAVINQLYADKTLEHTVIGQILNPAQPFAGWTRLVPTAKLWDGFVHDDIVQLRVTVQAVQ